MFLRQWNLFALWVLKPVGRLAECPRHVRDRLGPRGREPRGPGEVDMRVRQGGYGQLR